MNSEDIEKAKQIWDSVLEEEGLMTETKLVHQEVKKVHRKMRKLWDGLSAGAKEQAEWHAQNSAGASMTQALTSLESFLATTAPQRGRPPVSHYRQVPMNAARAVAREFNLWSDGGSNPMPTAHEKKLLALLEPIFPDITDLEVRNALKLIPPPDP